MFDAWVFVVQSLNSPFFPPYIGAEPGRAKEESRITCMRMRLMSYLKIYLQIAEMFGNKHIGYFYEKENFMGDTYRSLDKIEQGLPCGVVVWKIVSLARSSVL